ncbi:uncharacterized protein EHS24_003934 [Apiotrichum porosum]|uniref:Uncharacterized protein n=1 Tax=Apiotrichum porosum TaxID=105984 RepID=A0A427XDZ7_9TREE|nr:uncharacterized protein EHS24_003934 [Apiotrichum porosum]RSH76993.1 hypothetical protein EHS24_003934 [Apiotrichum porosum]
MYGSRPGHLPYPYQICRAQCNFGHLCRPSLSAPGMWRCAYCGKALPPPPPFAA